MTIEELCKEIIEIVNYRKKDRKQHNGHCWNTQRKYSIARLKRLRLMLNEMIREEERSW